MHHVVLMVTVLFNGQPLDCVVDTGAATILRADQAAVIRNVLPPESEPTIISTLNGPIRGEWRMVREMKAGGMAWKDVPVVVLLESPDKTPVGCTLGIDPQFRQPVVISRDGLRAA